VAHHGRESGYQYEFSAPCTGRKRWEHLTASEIPFVFGHAVRVARDAELQRVGSEVRHRRCSSTGSQLPKTGDPNGGSLVKWPRFDPPRRAYSRFTDAGPVAKEGLRREICDLFMRTRSVRWRSQSPRGGPLTRRGPQASGLSNL